MVRFHSGLAFFGYVIAENADLDLSARWTKIAEWHKNNGKRNIVNFAFYPKVPIPIMQQCNGTEATTKRTIDRTTDNGCQE